MQEEDIVNSFHLSLSNFESLSLGNDKSDNNSCKMEFDKLQMEMSTTILEKSKPATSSLNEKINKEKVDILRSEHFQTNFIENNKNLIRSSPPDNKNNNLDKVLDSSLSKFDTKTQPDLLKSEVMYTSNQPDVR